MSVTETTICNGALGFLSEGPITSLQDANELGRMCNEHYPVARRMAMQMHDWKFATTRALLTRLEETPPFGYAYYYQLPTGWLWTYETYPQDLYYVIEGQTVLTDYDAPGFVYGIDIEDTNLFSPLFVTTLELVLATRLCMVMTEKLSLRNAFKEEINSTLIQAKIRDARNNPSRETALVEMDLVRRSVNELFN